MLAAKHYLYVRGTLIVQTDGAADHPAVHAHGVHGGASGLPVQPYAYYALWHHLQRCMTICRGELPRLACSSHIGDSYTNFDLYIHIC